MPRHLTFRIGKKEFTASPLKIDRRKLYGWTELMALDDNGDPCDLLTADESGKYIIPLGGTGIGILSEDGRWVERSELKTVGADGEPAELFKSSYDTVNQLRGKITPEQMLDYSITDLYELEGASDEFLKALSQNIYLFDYSYNDSYDPSSAIVMVADGVAYLMVGVKNVFEMLCFGDCEAIDEDHDDSLVEEADEDIDFSMLF